MTTTTPQHRGLVTAVEFSRGDWIVSLECPPECTAENCSNFGSRLVIGRGGRGGKTFRTATEASAYRDEMHRQDPALIRLSDLQQAAR